MLGELVGRQDTLLGPKRLPSGEDRVPPLRPEQIELGARSFLVSHTPRLLATHRLCIGERPDLGLPVNTEPNPRGVTART